MSIRFVRSASPSSHFDGIVTVSPSIILRIVSSFVWRMNASLSAVIVGSLSVRIVRKSCMSKSVGRIFSRVGVGVSMSGALSSQSISMPVVSAIFCSSVGDARFSFRSTSPRCPLVTPILFAIWRMVIPVSCLACLILPPGVFILISFMAF